MNLGYLYSYGIGLIDSFGTKPHFIFNENKELLSKISKPKTTKKPVNIKSVAITLTCCVAWFFMTMFVSNRIVVSPSEKKASLEKQLGDKKGASTEKLKSKLTSLNKKLNYYKEVRYDSNIGQFLNELPSVMPDGTWLNTLTIAYTDSYAARGIAKGGEDKNEKFFEMDGFAYSENVNEQFQLVNELFSNLKKNLYIKEAFKNIGRDSSQKTNLSTYDVTKFTIKGN